MAKIMAKMAMRPWLAPAHVLLIVFLLATVTACSSSATPTGNVPGAVPTTAPTATPSPTPTPIPGCAQLAGFGGAASPSGGASFGDVPFPASSVGTAAAPNGGGAGHWSFLQFDVCTANSSAGAINTFFASGLPSAGWAQTATYPYDGQFARACGDPYCWKKDAAPRYVSLEKVTDAGNARVTYHMRLAIPPAPPACDPAHFGNLAYVSSVAGPNGTTIYLPPLTRVTTDLGGGHAGGTAIVYCSAGTAATIAAFMQTELPAGGFAASTADGPGWWKTSNGTLTWKIDLTISNPLSWIIDSHIPM